jgi:hypothetical protein
VRQKEEPVNSTANDTVEKADFSNVDREKDFMCFGTIEADNAECMECPFRERCADKAGVSL